MKRNKVVKIAVGTLVLLLLFCLAAVLLLLYCPPAQQKAAHWAVGWLQNRLQNTTRLDSFRLDFPRRITLKGVFLTDQKGDTLLYAGSLEVETNLWRLFHDTLPIRRVAISDTHIRLAQTDSGDLNFQFILDAFDDSKPPSGKPPGIFIAAQETPVLLENVRFEWDAPASQSYFCLKTDSLHSRLEQVRIDTFQLDFSQMADRSGRIVWRSGAPPPPTNGVFRYDNVDLQHHTLQIDRLSISTDSILATLADFQARDAGGLEVRHVSTEFSLIKNQLDLDRLALHANDSRVDGKLTLDIGDTLRYRANGLKGQLQSTDLTYFADLDFFKKNPGETFELFVTANGSLDELELQHFDFQTKKGTTALSLRGRLNNLRDLNNLGGDVTVERLRTDVRTLKTISPEIDLPKELAPGDVVELQGRARGTMRQLNLELRPRYQPANRGRPLTADVDATVFNASQPRLVSWKVRVNSLRVPGPLVEKTLPTGTLPATFTLPAETRISGNVNGDMRRLNGGLNVSTGEPGSTAHLDFSLNNWQGKNPQYQLDVTEATLDSALLAPFLKDSLLNQYLHLPPTVQVKGKLDGTTGNLSGEVHLLLPDSAQLGVAYRDSLSHQIVEMRSERFALMAFLRPEVLTSWGFDTLQRLDLQAKIELDTQQTLTVQGKAKRLDWSGWQISDLVLSGRQLAETGTYEALHVDARFDQKKAVEAVPFLSSGCLHAHIERLVLPYFDTLDDARRMVALGALALDSLELSRDTFQVFPGDVASQINFTGLKNSFEINSDWLAGSLKGDFDDRKLPQLLASWLNDHLRASPDSEALRPGKDSLEMSFALLKPELFTSGLIPDLTALDSLEIKGFYHPGLAGMQLKFRKMEWQGHSVQRLESIVSLDSKAATAVMRSPKLQLNFQTAPEAMDVGIRLEDGTAMSRLQTLDSLGDVRLSVGAKLKKDSVLQLSFDTTQILQYMRWTASPENRIMFPADGPLEIHDLELRQDSQLMRLDGDMKNRFRAEFHALDLSFVPRLLRMAPNALAGKLEGSVHIDSLQSDNPTIQTQLNFNNLKTYGEDVGDMKFTVRQEGRDKFGVNASVTGANEIDLHGNFSTKESMNLTAEIKRFRLELARPFVKEYLSECGGEISGQITIGGTLKKPDLNTSFQLKETAIRPLANNVRYRLNDQKVNISHNIVRFDSLQLNDERNRHAWLSGEVNLNRPDSIELDLRFLMQDFLLLQMKETDTISYFGTLMTDASGTVKGSIYQPTISVNVKPSGASQVYYKIVSEEQEMAESAGIVVFVNPNAPPQKIEEKVEEKATFPFRLDLNLELPNNLVKEDMMKVKVILNPLTRDILEAKGHGTLNLDVFPDGEIHLNGRLEVTTGTAEYSYNNFFKRKFTLVPGSNLIWTKDPYNPLMNLSAHYVVKTSPLPLLAGQSGNTDTTGTSKQTFWLTGSLNGYMDNVELKFKLEYPTDSEDGVSYGNSGDPQIKQAVNQVNENPTSLSQQVFSLLVFNTFSGAGIDQARVIDWQAGLNNLIAQQLNAMTSGITWIDIDFDLDDDSASGEADMDIRLKKSFFNNRVLFKASGETSINYSNAKRNLSGQFDEVSVEYKINKSGTLKATVFSEQTYNDLFLRRVNETGAGLIFEKEFGRVSDIFKRPNNNTAPAPKPAQ